MTKSDKRAIEILRKASDAVLNDNKLVVWSEALEILAHARRYVIFNSTLD